MAKEIGRQTEIHNDSETERQRDIKTDTKIER
jgi:hypothetical protein